MGHVAKSRLSKFVVGDCVYNSRETCLHEQNLYKYMYICSLLWSMNESRYYFTFTSHKTWSKLPWRCFQSQYYFFSYQVFICLDDIQFINCPIHVLMLMICFAGLKMPGVSAAKGLMMTLPPHNLYHSDGGIISEREVPHCNNDHDCEKICKSGHGSCDVHNGHCSCYN